MTGSRSLTLAVAVILALAACGGSDSGSSDSGSEQSESESTEVEVTTLGALGLDVPASIPGEFPLPGDTVLVKIDTVAAGGSDFDDVMLGTTVSRAELEAIIEPYLTGLPNGRYADSSGYAFVDGQEISLFVSTCENCETPPTTITFRVSS